LLDASARSSSRNDDMNAGRQSGFGRVQVTALDSVRFNAAKAFLGGVKQRPNLFVFKKSQATRVLFQGVTASGVQFVRDGVQRVVRARNEVILSAGAIGSPQLLMLSGVGPPEHLRTLNISVVKGLSGVGRNMQDHSQFLGATFSAPHQQQNYDDDVFQYFRHRRGPLSHSGALNSVTGFIATEFAASRDYPDVQMHYHGPFRNSSEVQQFAKMIGLRDDYTAALFE
jgi:choline dehydrogenase